MRAALIVTLAVDAPARFVAGSLTALLRLAIALFALTTTCAGPATGAEATTGAIVGAVTDAAGRPVSGARVTASAPSGRYVATTDAHGRYAILGVIPDAYAVAVTSPGAATAVRRDEVVLAGQTADVSFRLGALTIIGTVATAPSAFRLGAPSDTFTVTGAQARAHAPTTTSSGLGAYTEGTVQGSIANVPGVVLDPFGNAIVRSGKVSDTVFDYDSVPLPQGLIAEPGGNVVGAQIPTTGIASASVTLAGYEAESDNALGGVVNLIPATGTYPGRTTLSSATGSARGFIPSISSRSTRRRTCAALGVRGDVVERGLPLRQRDVVLSGRSSDVRARAAEPLATIGREQRASPAHAEGRSLGPRFGRRGRIRSVRLALRR